MNGHLSEELSDEYEEFPFQRRGCRRKSNRQEIQKEALDTLKSALLKVAPSIVDENMETINVPSINAALLRALNQELYKNEQNSCPFWVPRYLSFDGISRIDFAKNKRLRKQKRRIDEEIECKQEERENLPTIEERKNLTPKEILGCHKVLKGQLLEIEDIIKSPACITQINLSSRRSAEFTICDAFYQQKLMCSNISIEEEDFIFHGCNYNSTLVDIVYHFVHSLNLEDSYMVFSPNWSTLHGMETIQILQNRLNGAGKFINQSAEYIRYLIKRTKVTPKCIKCCIAENAALWGPKFNINQMEDTLIIPDETLTIASKVENRDPSIQVEKCCCEELANSRAEVEKMCLRFISLFSWPYLISFRDLKLEQEILMIRKKLPQGAPKIWPCDTYLQNCRKNQKQMAKRVPNGGHIVFPRVKRKRRQSCLSHRKVFIKQRYESESNSEEVPAPSSFLSSQTPLRRSQRTSALKKRTYTYINKYEDESS